MHKLSIFARIGSILIPTQDLSKEVFIYHMFNCFLFKCLSFFKKIATALSLLNDNGTTTHLRSEYIFILVLPPTPLNKCSRRVAEAPSLSHKGSFQHKSGIYLQGP